MQVDDANLSPTAEETSTIDSTSNRRKKLGRNARRRRKRVLAIEAAAAEAALGETSPADPIIQTMLPQDRSYQWPAVRDLCQLSDEDKHALIGQLGYLPGNAIKVVARQRDYFPTNSSADDEQPLAIQLYPLVLRHESDSTKSHRKRKQRPENSVASKDEKHSPLVEPFPTTYWVTHPAFRAVISKLELRQQETDIDGRSNEGTIRKFEKQLQTESTALDSMRSAHEQYGEERRKLITPEDWKWIQGRKWEGAFSTTRGVAGIRNPAGIKCLHAHAAHYWSGCKDNVVGKWVSDEVQAFLSDAKLGSYGRASREKQPSITKSVSEQQLPKQV